MAKQSKETIKTVKAISNDAKNEEKTNNWLKAISSKASNIFGFSTSVLKYVGGGAAKTGKTISGAIKKIYSLDGSGRWLSLAVLVGGGYVAWFFIDIITKGLTTGLPKGIEPYSKEAFDKIGAILSPMVTYITAYFVAFPTIVAFLITQNKKIKNGNGNGNSNGNDNIGKNP